MQQLCNVKQIRRNTTHKLSDLRIVIEGKRELLHMLEYFLPHIILHLCPHHMSVIAYEKAAVAVYCQQYKQADCNIDHLVKDYIRFTVDQRGGHIPHHQRDNQSHSGRQRCKKHICPKDMQIWLIVTDHFLQILSHSKLLSHGFLFYQVISFLSKFHKSIILFMNHLFYTKSMEE